MAPEEFPPVIIRNCENQCTGVLAPTPEMLSGKGKEKEPAGASVVSLTTLWADVGPQDGLPSGQTQTCHGDGVTIASIGLPYDKAADKLSLQEEDVGLAFNMGTWNGSQADKISVPVGIPYEGGADDCQIIGN
ncbi:hypothetical protein YC2023_089360 [Brassica napus]